jgi:hypothetical protein
MDTIFIVVLFSFAFLSKCWRLYRHEFHAPVSPFSFFPFSAVPLSAATLEPDGYRLTTRTWTGGACCLQLNLSMLTPAGRKSPGYAFKHVGDL